MVHEVWKKEEDYQLAKVLIQYLAKENLISENEMWKCCSIIREQIAPPVSELNPLEKSFESLAI